MNIHLPEGSVKPGWWNLIEKLPCKVLPGVKNVVGWPTLEETPGSGVGN
jgi:hypothetical protein